MAKHVSDIKLPKQATNPSGAGNAMAHSTKIAEPQVTDQHIEAISHLFTELELAYHNQFHKAFPDHQSLTMAKQLWLRLLVEYQAEHITLAGRKAICDNTFLPTLHNIREYCDAAATAGLPDVRAAYTEACLSREPRQNIAWTHPIVYYAGKATGWFFLSGQTESQTLPVFERNYELLIQRIKRGDTLSMPIAKAIEKQKTKPLEPEQQKEKLQALRKQLDL